MHELAIVHNKEYVALLFKQEDNVIYTLINHWNLHFWLWAPEIQEKKTQ